jgi:phage gp29-like protein
MQDGIWLDRNTFMQFSESVDRKDLVEEIASREAAWDWSGMVGLLPDPDPVLQAMGDGVEVLERLTADGHLCSAIQTRKLGTLKKEYKFEPYSLKGEKPSAEAVKLRDQLVEDLERVSLYDLISGLLDTPFYGMTPVEIQWSAASDRMRIKGVEVKPARWFGFNDANKPRFVSANNPWDGEDIPFGKFVFSRHFPTYDNPYGLRLLSRCFWPVIFKKGGIKFWVTLAEKYGMPFLVGQYARGTTPEQQQEMLSNLSKMVRDAVAVIPQGGSVDVVESQAGGKAEIHSGLVTAMNAEISKVIMGQTLTAEVGDKGSLAAGRVHENTLDDFRHGDQKLVKTAMEEIAWIYGQVNAPGVPTPVFSWHEEDDPKKDFAERDQTLSDSGVRFTKAYYKRTYNLQDGDFDLSSPDKEEPASDDFAEGGGFTAQQQALEDLAEEVIPQGGESLEVNEKAILNAVSTATSYEEAMAQLLELYPALKVAELQDLLERTLLNADLFGRSAVQGD